MSRKTQRNRGEVANMLSALQSQLRSGACGDLGVSLNRNLQMVQAANFLRHASLPANDQLTRHAHSAVGDGSDGSAYYIGKIHQNSVRGSAHNS